MLPLLAYIIVAQTQAPPEFPADVAQWVVYVLGALWAGDKAWFHTTRLRSQKSEGSDKPLVPWISSEKVDRIAEVQERQIELLSKQSEVLGLMSENQHHHVETTKTIQGRLDILERKMDQALQQAIINGRDLEHLQRQVILSKGNSNEGLGN